MNRRTFLAASGIAMATRATRANAASDRVRVACVGVRGRGTDHIHGYSKLPGAELAALCDVDEAVLAARLKEIDAAGGKRPKTYTDFRKLLEDPSIDAVSIATPNHHHTLQTIWACQAGKHVYVEKPVSHNIFECRQIVAVAQKYGRVVQAGTQARSSAAIQDSIRRVREGAIGEIYMARALCFKWRDTIGRAPEEAVPSGVHYDQWVGPAPLRPFTRNRFHYNWHWNWDYGNGDIGNQGIHQIDLARWALGVKYPTRVSAMGGHYLFNDDQQTPNTMVATFEFDRNGSNVMLVAEVRHWISNHEGVIGGATSDTIGNTIYGSKGYMTFDGESWAGVGEGYRTFLGREQREGAHANQPSEHFANFVEAVHQRDPKHLNAPIQEGATSAVLVHLANISYRLHRTLRFDPTTLTCPGDEEANRLFTRNYRAPYVVPVEV
jgi:predicted dehydrogenase